MLLCFDVAPQLAINFAAGGMRDLAGSSEPHLSASHLSDVCPVTMNKGFLNASMYARRVIQDKEEAVDILCPHKADSASFALFIDCREARSAWICGQDTMIRLTVKTAVTTSTAAFSSSFHGYSLLRSSSFHATAVPLKKNKKARKTKGPSLTSHGRAVPPPPTRKDAPQAKNHISDKIQGSWSPVRQ